MPRLADLERRLENARASTDVRPDKRQLKNLAYLERKVAELRAKAAPAPTPVAPAEIVAPHQNWLLIAQRRFTSGKLVIDRGCAVEPAMLGRNFQSMLDRGFVTWVPPGRHIAGKPRTMPTPKPTRANPKVEIVPDSDPCVSYKKSRDRLAALLGGDFGKANDLMLADKEGSRLNLLAQRVGSERASRTSNQPARRIVPVL